MGYKIKEKRVQLGISQEQLSEMSGVSRSIISGLESGKTTVTTTETLLKISKALGCKVKDNFLPIKFNLLNLIGLKEVRTRG